jgi:hypothetical protein
VDEEAVNGMVVEEPVNGMVYAPLYVEVDGPYFPVSFVISDSVVHSIVVQEYIQT